MSKLIERRIECPFYLNEGNRFITCEGILKGTKTTHRFRTNDVKVIYENEVCCCNGGKRCQHFRNVSILYERGLRN